jgi:RES domain-containing protein
MTPQLPETVFRVTRPSYVESIAHAFSGVGGLHGDGRWHSRGNRIVYTSQSTTLCLFERLVHAVEWIVDELADRVILTVRVPPVSYKAFTARELAEHDPNWRLESNLLCRRLGNDWIADSVTCALMVPSAANPGDYNILFNPMHQDFELVLAANTTLEMSSVEMDERIVSFARAHRMAGL